MPPFINQYGVNVPYGDEWSIVLLFEKWDSHQLTFADFYGAHNGHRILIPRLIYLAVTQLTHGSLRAEMFFSLLCILTSAGIYLLLRRTVSGSTTKHLALVLAGTFSFGNGLLIWPAVVCRCQRGQQRPTQSLAALGRKTGNSRRSGMRSA